MLHVLEVETPDGTEWLLTDDLEQARQTLADSGGVEIAVHDPADILASQYEGIARLGTC
ncbi:MAG: hypothetical protein V5B33_07875 [Candidatus Accumulibacter sp. UW20]|jgi:hypothetical protein